MHGRLDGVGLVVLVVDGKVAVKADALAVPAEDAGANGVKGSHGYGFAGAEHQAVKPLPHLPGRLVGEGYGQDAPGGDATLGDQIGDAVGNNAGFAGAWSGDNQQRPLSAEHGLLLRLVQPLQDGRRTIRRRPSGGCRYFGFRQFSIAPVGRGRRFLQ